MDQATAAFVRFRTKGDLQALGEVFDAQAPRLLALALHLCGNAPDAEDALQAAFVVAMNKAGTFDPRAPLGPWLAGILAHEARSTARRERRRAGAELPERAAVGDPAADAERRELVATLRTHIEALPAEQRQVLLLQLQYGLQPAEIAEVVGAPPGTVRMRLHRGLQALRAVLPASLVATFATLLPSRGIAAVRADVLRLAAAEAVVASGTVGTVGTVALGGALTKKLMLAATALAAVACAWWALVPDRAPAVTPMTTERAVVRTAPSEQPRLGAGAGEAGPLLAANERTIAPAAAGTLRVRVCGDVIFRAREIGVVRPSDQRVPLRDVLVEARPVGGPAPTAGSVRTARTDDAGEVGFAELAPALWELRALRADGWTATEVHVAQSAERTAEIVVPVLPMLQGRVVDARGVPVAGAEVVAAQESRTDYDEQFHRVAAITDPDGAFRCATTDGESRVGARKAGHANSWTHPLTTFDGDGPVTLVLGERPGSITFDIADAPAGSLGDLHIDVTAESARLRRAADGSLAGPPLGAIARDAGGGRFIAEGLAAAVYRCRLRANGRLARVTLQPGQGCTFVARDLGLTDRGADGAGSSGEPGPDLRFDIVARDGGDAAPPPPPPPPAGVRGRVVDEAGQPIAGADVVLSDKPLVTADGTFAFDGLYAGGHGLFATAAHRVAVMLHLTLEAGERRDVGDVVLRPGAELRVRFLRPDGSPWRERPPMPRLIGATGKPQRHEHRVEHGVVIVTGIAPGRYEVAGPDDGELLVVPQVVDVQLAASAELRMPTELARQCALRIDLDTPLSQGEAVDVQVRRGDGVVVLQKTATRGPSGLVVECVLPVGELVVEARRGDRITHRAEIAVSRVLRDRSHFAVSPVR